MPGDVKGRDGSEPPRLRPVVELAFDFVEGIDEAARCGHGRFARAPGDGSVGLQHVAVDAALADGAIAEFAVVPEMASLTHDEGISFGFCQIMWPTAYAKLKERKGSYHRFRFASIAIFAQSGWMRR